MGRKERVRNKNMSNSGTDNGWKVGKRGTVFMTNKGHREANTSIIAITLLHYSNSKTNSDNIYKRHK